MILIIFTNTYPYDAIGEQTFLAGEIRILAKYFERIILAPQEKHARLLPVQNGIEVDLEFADNFTFTRRIFAFLRGLFSKDLYLDIKDHLPFSLTLKYLKRLFFFISGAHLTQNWLTRWAKKEDIVASDIVCYTYWFTEITMGLGWVKRINPELRVISRAHGFDLYEELYKPWPLRLLSISLLDGLYTDSDIGNKYLVYKYPQFKDKYSTALLGVPAAGGLSRASDDGVLRIFSCSMINPIKRLDLLFAGIVTAAQIRKDQKFEWTHFGGGIERQVFISRILNEFPPNAKGYFPGYQSQQDLIQTYITKPVDVFVNVSSTEGTPVSIMEAISCGIPIIATAVGGNIEIVQEKNGFLLSENPTPDEIASALLKVCDHPEEMLNKRQGSREVWWERYNEIINFEAFAQKLVEIRKH